MKLLKKIKIKINKECKDYLDFASEQCRLLYNFALAERIEYYKQTGNTLNFWEQKRKLKEIKKRFPEYTKVYNQCLMEMYFRLRQAYDLFFNNVKNKETIKKGFPKFKRKHQFISQTYAGDRIKRINDYEFYIPAGQYEHHIHRFIAKTREQLPSHYGNVTIKKEKNNYFACFTIDCKEQKCKNNNEILAIDLGIKTLVSGYSSENKFVKASKFSHYTKHFDTLRSKRDAKKKGSRKWAKLNLTLWKRLNKYDNRVNDYLHKVSKWICFSRTESTIVIGKLCLNSLKSEMTWHNKLIYNEWRIGKFIGFLTYKSIKYGKVLKKISEKNTTRMCCKCNMLKEMSLSDRIYNCSCGFSFDRDLNSAINIYKKYCLAEAIPIHGIRFDDLSSNNLNVDKFVYI